MNLWDHFFTTQISEPPKFELLWYVSLLRLLAFTFYASYRYRDKVAYQRFFRFFNLFNCLFCMVGTGGIICPCQKVYPFTIVVWPCLWCS